jgi:hypothetical protein
MSDYAKSRHDEPTYENQLWHARKLMAEKGREAVYNPHGMIGKACGCGSCFCCAALAVVREYDKATKDGATWGYGVRISTSLRK